MTAIPPTWSNWSSVITSLVPLLVLSIPSPPTWLKTTLVTESGEPATTMALPPIWCIEAPAKSRPKPLGVRAEPALTVRPSS
ncbi:MAG: hypothetical protein E6J00_02735 [Chloroflexi bacterium]|nr:MAG: hypothetical protein E6J00_02735 [Chloroflexota bacterium]